MKKTFKIVAGVTVLAVAFWIEGAAMAIGLLQSGVKFELPTGVVFEVQTEGHQFELVGE